MTSEIKETGSLVSEGSILNSQEPSSTCVLIQKGDLAVLWSFPYELVLQSTLSPPKHHLFPKCRATIQFLQLNVVNIKNNHTVRNGRPMKAYRKLRCGFGNLQAVLSCRFCNSSQEQRNPTLNMVEQISQSLQ